MAEILNLQDLEEFAKKFGTIKASKLLSVLGKNKQFLNAWESPIGIEMLSGLTQDLENLLELIVNEKATDTEKADFRAIYRLLMKVSERINIYNQNIEVARRRIPHAKERSK